jgi:hypothetical protein
VRVRSRRAYEGDLTIEFAHLCSPKILMRSGESMQTYIWKRLVADALRPSPSEIVARARLRLDRDDYPTEPVDIEAYMAEGQV